MATGRRASRLANQLLALARAESMGTTGVRQPVLLNALCESVARDVLPQAIEREIDFAFEPAPAELAVMGDATLLGELARNLVDNAFQRTPRGGSVVLAVLGEPSRIVVDDSGPGVAEADRERVFAPFSRVAQLDTESGTPIPGTGLGLAIVRGWRRRTIATVGINLFNERREICCQFRVSRASERRKPRSLTFTPLSPRQVRACGIHRRGFLWQLQLRNTNASDDR